MRSGPVGMTVMHSVLTHPLPHRAQVHVALTLARSVVMPRRALRTPVLLAHLGHALLVALALILGVVVVHAVLLSCFGLDRRVVSTESDTEGGIYARLPENAIANYARHFSAFFSNGARNLAFHLGLDTFYSSLTRSTCGITSSCVDL